MQNNLIVRFFNAIFAEKTVPLRKRQRRNCRIEELESREMLSVSPWNAVQYTEPEFPDYVETLEGYSAEAVWETGDVTIKGNAEVYVDSYGNALIGSKNYSITFSVGGTYEAFLTGLTENEVSSIVAGVFDVNPYDAEKTGYGDSSLCWAGTASNMLAYTGWGDVNGFQTADDIFAYFNANFTNTGGWMDRGCEWFITGKYAGSYNSAQLVSAASGGFYSVEDGSAVTSLKVANNVSKVTNMIDHLQSGSAVALALSYTGLSASHAVTLWGVVYDTSLSPTDPNYYKALMITDSDDNYGSGANAPNRLKCISIESSTSGWYFLTSYYGRSNCYVYGYTALAARPGYDNNIHVITDTIIDINYREVPLASVSPAPVKVSNFRATASNTRVVLTWDACEESVSYEVKTALNKKGKLLSAVGTDHSTSQSGGIKVEFIYNEAGFCIGAIVSGLKAKTKYNFSVTAKKTSDGNTFAGQSNTQTATVQKVVTTPKLLAAPAKIGKVQKGVGSVTFNLKDIKGVPAGADVVYEVGVYDRKSKRFLWGEEAKAFAPEVTGLGILDGKTVSLSGLTYQKYKLCVRATATVGDRICETKVRKIKVTPAKYAVPNVIMPAQEAASLDWQPV